MDKNVKDAKLLVDDYKEKLSKLDLEPALIDYLVSIAARAFSEVKTLSSFTSVKIDIDIF